MRGGPLRPLPAPDPGRLPRTLAPVTHRTFDVVDVGVPGWRRIHNRCRTANLCPPGDHAFGCVDHEPMRWEKSTYKYVSYLERARSEERRVGKECV